VIKHINNKNARTAIRKKRTTMVASIAVLGYLGDFCKYIANKNKPHTISQTPKSLG
jgi:hypothetical protein